MDQLRLGDVYDGSIRGATVVGCGALGSATALQLAKIGVPLTLIDFDVIEAHNIPNQLLFGPDDVGRPKVEVLAERLRMLTDTPIVAINAKVELTSHFGTPAVFACVDSMTARACIFGAAGACNVDYMFDGRIGARNGTCIGFDMQRTYHGAAYMQDWLYSDEVVTTDRAACGTILSIGATASLCASYLVWQFMELVKASREEALDEEVLNSQHSAIVRMPVIEFDITTGRALRYSL